MDNSLALFWNDHLFSDMFTSYFLNFTRQFFKSEAFSDNDTVNAKKIVIFLQNINRVIFLYVLYSTLLHLLPLRFHCVGASEYAGIIEPRTVAVFALAVRRSNHSARSHPPQNIIIIIMFE